MKLICGNSNRPLAEAIAAHMRVPLAECNVRRFADEEVFVEIQENVRGMMSMSSNPHRIPQTTT